MKFNRNCSSCRDCPLREKTRVHGEGGFSSKIAFIGEAPGFEENELGRPFVGQSGSFFNWGLGEAKIFRYQSWVTNVISCQPPGNKIVSLEGMEAIGKCKKGFLKELKFLSQRGIKVLVPLGATAIEALSLEGKITKIRGSVYERILWEMNDGRLLLRESDAKMSKESKKIGSFVIVPTFHPSYLLRYQYKRKDGKANFKYVWIEDLKKAKEIQEKGWTPPKENFNTSPNIEEFSSFLKTAELKGQSLAVDIETTGLSLDYGHIVCIGFARDKENAICIPLLDKGGKQYWKSSERMTIDLLLNKAFQMPMIYQNALFDVLRLQKAGYKISMSQVEHDTMILHHSISPELPHNLGFIVSVYGDTPYWKEDFSSRIISILEMNQKEMRIYNLRDCVVLHQVVPGLLKDLIEGCLEETYYEEGILLLKPFGKMITNGIGFDVHEQKLVKGRYQRKVKKLEKELYALGKLPEEFNLNSDDDLRYLLYRIEPNKFKRIGELKDFITHKEYEIKCPECKKKSWLNDGAIIASPCPRCGHVPYDLTGKERIKSKRKRGTQVHQLLLDVKKLKEQTVPFNKPKGLTGMSTPKGKISVGQPGILSYMIAVQKRIVLIDKFITKKEVHLKEKEELKFILKWLSIYNEWNEDHKIMNDFTKYKPSLDGRLHGSLLIHGTNTGRPSMKGPNLLQVPKRAKDIRKMFIARPGHSFVSGDHSNLEVHVLAHETGEPNLKPVIEGKINLHDENTKILFGINKGHKYWNKARDGAKTYQFARVQYGGGQRSIHAKVCLKCPNIILPFEKFRKADDAYFEKYSVLRAWQENQREIARKTRTVSTFLGRRRILMGEFHEIERQALNTPIQGGAAGIVNRETIRLDNEVEKRNMKAYLVLQIYDQILYEVKDEIIPEFAALMKKEMERPLDFYGTEVSFPVDIEVGKTWGTLEKYKE